MTDPGGVEGTTDGARGRRGRRPGSIGGIVVVMVLAVVGAGVSLAAASSVTKGGGDGDSVWLGSRTTDDGVTIRLTETGSRPELVTQFRRMGLPDDCFTDRTVGVGVSSARTAQQLELAFFPAAGPDAAQGFRIEGPQPVEVVVARAPRGAARAAVRFPDGKRDETDRLGGYFAMARRTQSGRSAFSGVSSIEGAVVTYFDADGDRLGRTRSTEAFGGPLDFSRVECQPRSSSTGSGSSSSGTVVIGVPATQPLPEPTGAPPADEASARAAITAAFEGAYPAAGDIDAALAHVEGGDSPALREARQKASDANPQYVGRTTVVVTEIRFLDDREAAVRFEFRLDGQPFYAPQVGFATLTADGWKMSRSTYCDQLQTAGPGIKC